MNSEAVHARPQPEDGKFDPRAQLSAVVLSTFVALLYIFATQAAYNIDSYPSVWFFIVAAIIVLAGYLGSQSFSWLIPKRKEGKSRFYDRLNISSDRALNWYLYLNTFASIMLLGAATVPTGGPIRSPYAVILLAVALIAPFVTNEIQPTLVVTSMVAVSYLTWWAFVSYSPLHPMALIVAHDKKGNPIEYKSTLIALTSFASVAISIFLEYVRRSKEESLTQEDKTVQAAQDVAEDADTHTQEGRHRQDSDPG